jgi:hypothetical protein
MEVGKLKKRIHLRLGPHNGRDLGSADSGLLPLGPPKVADMLMLQDGEEPTPQISAGLPEMLLGECPQKAVLHEIVGLHCIAGQHTSIPAQRRDLLHE